MSNAKNKLSLNQQLAELDAIIAWFEQDDFDIEEALAKYEQGMQLAAAIKNDLSSVENKITILKASFDQDE